MFLRSLIAVALLATTAHTAVVFEDGFETGNYSKWDETRYADRMHVATEAGYVPFGHGIRYRFDYPGAGENGGELIEWFQPGYDEIYYRAYYKWPTGFEWNEPDPRQGGMHGLTLLGNRRDNNHSAFGQAGVPPNGTDYFYAGVDPRRHSDTHNASTLGWFEFYTYFADQQSTWGTVWTPQPAENIVRETWYCVEHYVKLNTVSPSVLNDGSQTLWVNGVKVIDVGPMRWRTSDILTLNTAWICTWGHPTGPETMYLDDVKVSTAYIGPIGSADVTPPTIQINSPDSAEIQTAENGTFSVFGVADDDQDLVLVTWTNDRGGEGEATGTTTWSATLIALAEGTNVISVYAIDAAGHESSDSIVVVSAVSGLPDPAPVPGDSPAGNTPVNRVGSVEYVGPFCITPNSVDMNTGMIGINTRLSAPAEVTLTLYTIDGSPFIVESLGELKAGDQRTEYDLSTVHVPTGLYVAALSLQDRTLGTQPLLILGTVPRN